MLSRLQQEELRTLPLWAGLGANTKIRLTRDSIKFGVCIGNKRQDTAIERRLRDNNGLVADDWGQRRIHILGALCEMAAWIYLGFIHWNCYVFDPSDLPDLSDWIEVKGAKHPGDTLIVPPKKNKTRPPLHWAYVLVNACDHPVYEIVGWRWGWEFLDKEKDQSLPRPAWRSLPPYRPPIDLLEEVRLR